MSMILWSALRPNCKPSNSQQASSESAKASSTPREVMTILIHFHQSQYRTFKAYYTEQVQVHLSSEFPRLVSYQRFVALIPSVLVALLAYAARAETRACTGISFLDSTGLPRL